MKTFFLIAALLTLGQGPEEVVRGRTYRFEDGDIVYYGYEAGKDPKDGQLIIELDDPLKREVFRQKKISADALKFPESPDDRIERIDRQLGEKGYVRVELPDGGWKPVLKSEVELARRAREMVEAQEAARSQGVLAAAGEAAVEPDGAASRSPGGRRWVLAGLVVLMGAGLAGLLLKLSFAGGAST